MTAQSLSRATRADKSNERRDVIAMSWRRVAMSLAMIVLLTVAVSAQSADVRVYVFTSTDTSGFTDPLQAQRVESLADLKRVMEKKKGIEVVDRVEDADLTLEITDAGKLETGAQRTKGLSTGLDGAIFGTRTSQEKRPQVRTTLRAGTYRIEFHGIDRSMKRAADAVAQGVEKWIKQNHDLLEERRSKPTQ
jgi:hypothetical protein